jgi:integration host factor subunit beta
MTKREIIAELLARHPNLAHHESEVMVNALFDAMTEMLQRGERIELRGFGTFGVKDRSAREGRNPKTGASVSVVAKRVPFFRAGKELLREVNGVPAGPPEESH